MYACRTFSHGCVGPGAAVRRSFIFLGFGGGGDLGAISPTGPVKDREPRMDCAPMPRFGASTSSDEVVSIVGDCAGEANGRRAQKSARLSLEEPHT